MKYETFIGQIPDEQNEYHKDPKWKDAWGSRVKVRIVELHDPKLVSNENLPWAIVLKPTTCGGINGQTSNLWGGDWVTGYFLDEDKQIPVITGVLDRNANKFDITKSQNGSTSFQSLSRYNSGMEAGTHQTKGGKKPAQSGANSIPKSTFDNQKTSDKLLNNISNVPSA